MESKTKIDFLVEEFFNTGKVNFSEQYDELKKLKREEKERNFRKNIEQGDRSLRKGVYQTSIGYYTQALEIYNTMSEESKDNVGRDVPKNIEIKIENATTQENIYLNRKQIDPSSTPDSDIEDISYDYTGDNFFEDMLIKYPNVEPIMNNFKDEYTVFNNSIVNKEKIITQEESFELWETIFNFVDIIYGAELYKNIGKEHTKFYDIKTITKDDVSTLTAHKISHGTMRGFINKLYLAISDYIRKGKIISVIKNLKEINRFVELNTYTTDELKKYLIELVNNWRNYDNIIDVFTEFKKLEWLEYENNFHTTEGSIFEKYSTRSSIGDLTITTFKTLLNEINKGILQIIKKDFKGGLDTPKNSFYLRMKGDIVKLLEKYRHPVSKLITDIYKEIENNTDFEKADLKLLSPLYFNGEEIISPGNVEVKKLYWGVDSYLSEFYSYGKDEFYAELLKSRRIINNIYNYIIQKVFEKLENSDKIINMLSHNLSAIIFSDFLITPSKNLIFYWSNKGRSSCKQLRLSIRFQLISDSPIYKLNESFNKIISKEDTAIEINKIKCENNPYEGIDYDDLIKYLISPTLSSEDNYISEALGF